MDPDKFVLKNGPDAFRDLVKKAQPWYLHSLQKLLIHNPETAKETDQLIRGFLVITAAIHDPIYKDICNREFIKATQALNIHIGLESIEEVQNCIEQERLRKEREEMFLSLMAKTTNLQQQGHPEKAFKLLKDGIKEISETFSTENYKAVLAPITEDSLKEELAQRPDSLNTGYMIGQHETPILLPPGALTFICGPTGSGKTALTLNTILKAAKRHPDRFFILITIEENWAAVTIKLLSIYCGEKLANNNKASLYSFFKNDTDEYISGEARETFHKNKDDFFNNYLATGRVNVQYTDGDVESILDMVTFVQKNSKLPVGAVFIDYMQLLHLSPEKHRFNSRQEELKKVCLILKDYAVETNLPIVLGAQFNREVKNLLQMDPTRIGEAGDIERIASLIIGIWNNKTDGICSKEEKEEVECITYRERETLFVKILKNRDGEVGIQGLLHFDGNIGRISNKNIITGPEKEL